MANNNTTKMVRLHRKRTVFPATPSECHQIKLSALDLQMLFAHYIQKGLLYQTPTPTDSFSSQVDLLAKSLSQVLVKFYPIAGRFTTSPSDGAIYIDCNDSGVDFIEATAGHLSIADLTTSEVTPAVEDLFALHGAVNLDGHRLPLLVVQVTQLKDGISVCCTMNHALVDGVSFWHFFNSWADLCRTNGNKMSVIHDRSLLNPGGSAVRLGLDPDGQIPRFCPPPLRVKMFHFSPPMVRALKERANRDSPVTISSFQALCGHVWQAVTRARALGPDEPTTFRLSVNCRPRVLPPLPSSYFGNAIQHICTTATVRELSGLPLSFPAGLLNGIIGGHRDGVIKERIDVWEKEPVVYRPDKSEKNILMMGSSPRFEMYEIDFGWGEAMAVRSGSANHFDGKVSAYPGKEGAGSVDLEICLLPHTMNALDIDHHFFVPILT